MTYWHIIPTICVATRRYYGCTREWQFGFYFLKWEWHWHNNRYDLKNGYRVDK